MYPQSAAPSKCDGKSRKEKVELSMPTKTTAINQEDESIVAQQQRRILKLQQEVESLSADNSLLESSLLDLREKNVSLAKKLARCGRRGRAFRRSSASRSRSRSRSIDRYSDVSSDNGDGADDGDDSDDVDKAGTAAAVDAMEWLVRAKDEQLREFECRSRASDEMIAILRRQVSSVMKEKSNVEKKLRGNVERAERKNAALKHSIAACDSSIEIMKTQVEEVRSDADKRVREVEEKRDAEKRSADETIASLRQRLKCCSETRAQGAIVAAKDGETPKQVQVTKNDLKKEDVQKSLPKVAEHRKESKILGGDLTQPRGEDEVLHHSSPYQHCAVTVNYEEFNHYFQPVVKNLTFLLEMRDQTIRSIKMERDKALEEAEWYREESQRLARQNASLPLVESS